MGRYIGAEERRFLFSHQLIHHLFSSHLILPSTNQSSTLPTYLKTANMRFFVPLFLLSLSAFAAPSTSSSSEVESSNSTLESRTFPLFCPSGTERKLTKCCPHEAYEFNWQCHCSNPSKTLSADGKRCEQKCSQSGWSYCHTQCCPPGSDEVNGQCKVCFSPCSTHVT
jgi:hypothetical protein